MYVVIVFVVRMYCLQQKIDEVMKYTALIPYLVLTNYTLFCCLVDNMIFAIFSQLYTASICYYFNVFEFRELFSIFYFSVITILAGLSSIRQTLKVHQLLAEQTLHMSAIHHEIKTPLQVIKHFSFFFFFFLKQLISLFKKLNKGNNWCSWYHKWRIKRNIYII